MNRLTDVAGLLIAPGGLAVEFPLGKNFGCFVDVARTREQFPGGIVVICIKRSLDAFSLRALQADRGRRCLGSVNLQPKEFLL